MSGHRFFVDPAMQAAAEAERAAIRAQERKERTKLYWREGWADAQTGPLPFVMFLVSSWRRLTHKAHPSFLALKALTAAQEAIVQRLPDPDDYRALSGFQKARLDVLRWLIGDKDIEGASSELADLRLVPSSTLPQIEPVEGQAIRQLRSTDSQSPMTTRPVRQSSPQAASLPDLSAPLPAAVQSQAISNDSRSVPTQPPSAGLANEEETIAKRIIAHRLSETSK